MPLPTREDAVKQLADYLDEAPDDLHVVAAAEEALVLLGGRFTQAEYSALPDEVGSLATREAGASLYYRRTARNGITTFGSADVTPMRIAKDPLSTVYPILSPYLSPGFA